MRELRLREVKSLAQGHPLGQWPSSVLASPGSLLPPHSHPSRQPVPPHRVPRDVVTPCRLVPAQCQAPRSLRSVMNAPPRPMSAGAQVQRWPGAQGHESRQRGAAGASFRSALGPACSQCLGACFDLLLTLLGTHDFQYFPPGLSKDSLLLSPKEVSLNGSSWLCQSRDYGLPASPPTSSGRFWKGVDPCLHLWQQRCVFQPPGRVTFRKCFEVRTSCLSPPVSLSTRHGTPVTLPDPVTLVLYF